MPTMKNFLIALMFLSGCMPSGRVSLTTTERGDIGMYGNKFIRTGTGEAFVPNLVMMDVLTRNIRPEESQGFKELDFPFRTGNYTDLRFVTRENLRAFIKEFFEGHGFNGIHVPVYGQWFHIGDNVVKKNDSVPDPRTFEKLAMIIQTVYEAGGVTYIWVWGDHQRRWTAESTQGGTMGAQEKLVMDRIAEKLGPLKGWFIGYGFDLWEWADAEELEQWHSYMWAKPGWNKLMGARGPRSGPGNYPQIYEGLDFSSYEHHKPWFDELVEMINVRPDKPSFSGDRYRIRRNPPSQWPEKDYNEVETRRGLWHHTMAGGVGAIWGNLDSTGVYSNKEELKCFSVFWNDKNRFRKDMVVDNSLSNGFCLRDSDTHYVFYKEDCDKITFRFSGKAKKVVAVDTRKTYQEMTLGKMKSGDHQFMAPYVSDWAVAVE